MKKPQIFVTNDDGFHAKGIQALLEVVKELGDVLCIAPSTGQSGMAHAITFTKPLRLNKQTETEFYKAYDFSGTPVDCVKMGLDKFYNQNNPDLIISGINHGSNASICSIYSGTVAAAREGAVNNIPSIAFSSLDFNKNADFEDFKVYIKAICLHILNNGLDKGVFLNVNMPFHDTKNIKGVKVCRQTDGVWVEEFDGRKDPNNQEYYWLTGHFDNFEENAEDSDEWLLKENYITVVPLQLETTHLDSLKSLEKINS